MKNLSYEKAQAKSIYENAERLAKGKTPKLTQTDLAEAIGIGRYGWSKRKRNGTVPTQDEIEKLCILLGCGRDDIEALPYVYAKQFGINPDSGELKEQIMIMAFRQLDVDEQQNVLDLVMNLWKWHDRLDGDRRTPR